MDEKVLEVKDIVKYYGSGNNVVKAVDNISFDVVKGEFLAIMGASGSGKTTLLSIISTIDGLSSGHVNIEGTDISEMSEQKRAEFRRDRLGFVFQSYNLLDTLTIGENILLPLDIRKIASEKAEKKLSEVSEMLGITHLLDKFPDSVSGGERQRAACARALITDPAIIMADEPTGALDSANSKNLLETIHKINKSENVSVIIVTHDASAAAYADRVLFLKDGRIWNEVYRGERSRREMYNDIIGITVSLGGEGDAF